MDNQTRRILLERVKASGFPGSIMDVFQNPTILDQYIAEQQQQQQQEPVVAQTPQEQEQGLRPYHEQGQVNQSMAFPNFQPGQSFNTVGMKIPIDINKYNNQGHLVESYKAVPPGISNLPTGPNEGMVIESPAKMQKGGVRQKVYNDPLKFAEANRLYNDSLDLYTQFPAPEWMSGNRAIPWSEIEKEYKTDDYYKEVIRNNKVVLDQRKTKNNIAPVGLLGVTGNTETSDASYDYVYKKPTQEPVYKEKQKEYIPTKAVKLERKPIELIIPESDRTLDRYNNTMQVLRSVQQDDRDRQGPKVVKAPNFKSGGYIIGGLKNRVLYNKAKYKR